MALNGHGAVAAIAMEDELGITYLVENAQQFWSEIEDMLDFGRNAVPTLSLLDSTLRRFLSFCSSYHGEVSSESTESCETLTLNHQEQYLQSPLQLEHACELLMESELFRFHSERMCEILQTDPHAQLIFYHVLLSYGRRRTDFFRAHKRWQPLLPLIMDHILVEIDPDVEDTYFGVIGGSGKLAHVPIPIEAKLRGLGVQLLYEVCRVQKLSVQDLRIFDDAFIDYLFDLVEQTRHMHDETFNYSVIKLLVSLNEQYMVASIGNQAEHITTTPESDSKNRLLNVLMRRLGATKTFGENMIYMLNRADRTPEDLCMQLLILKLLYVLFTTKGTSEYFYTNDLCVLVDVFLRELVDLDEESEPLRHTYLRVLHPLLTKTQLRDIPYKRPQIVYTLESLVAISAVRDVNPTTKRLVERCLSGNWCVNLIKVKQTQSAAGQKASSPEIDAAMKSPTAFTTNVPAASQLQRSNSKTLKTSRSVEHLRARSETSKSSRSPIDNLLRANNSGSSVSLNRVTHTGPSDSLHPPLPKRRGTAHSVEMNGPHTSRHTPVPHVDADFHNHHHQLIAPSKSLHNVPDAPQQPPVRRSAPPPPTKRRKPPAIPTQTTLGGGTITTIKSSATMPQIKVAHS
ncbi:hypothetical protein H0H93_005916 [Arthromyces matolae]|nr:hypothetical protein H0H93_005916 [Arthromyces matolae]